MGVASFGTLRRRSMILGSSVAGGGEFVGEVG